MRCSGYYSPDNKIAFCTREDYAGDLTAPLAGAPLPTWAHFLAGKCKCGTDHAHQAPEARALRQSDQGAPRGYAGPPKRGEAPYTYTDEGGAILFQVRRVALPEGGKTFYQVHYEQARGGWVHGRGAAPLALYRLPVIADASPDTPVFFCEGEKDVESLERLGLVATCNAGGALKNADAWRAEYGAALRDRPVIILQDNDIPGARHAEIARNALYGLARSVKTMPTLGEAPGYDISDWLAEGNGKEQLLALAEQIPAWAPETGEALLSLYTRQHAEQIKAGALASVFVTVCAPLAGLALAEREALLCDLARALLDYATRAIDTLRAAPVPISASAGRDLMRGARGEALRAMLKHLQRSARRSGLALQKAEIEIAWREALQSIEGAIIRAPRQSDQGAAITLAAPGEPLVRIASGDIHQTAEGIYLDSKRGRMLLGAPVRVLRVASGDNAALYHLAITPPKGEEITLAATDREIEKGLCWHNLDGQISPLPSTQGEYDALYAALRALAVCQDNVKRQRLASALGWQRLNGRLVWVQANGVQDGLELLIGEEAPLFANTREIAHPPFTLPETSGAPSVAPLRELLRLWSQEQTLFTYAAIGAHAQVSKPLASEEAGTLDFALEGIAETGEGKSTCLNWVHRLFQGTGYRHNTPTLLNDNGLTKDSGIGAARLRALMKYHAYQTADRNAKPGNNDYQRQQDTRVKWLMSIGNRDAAGVRAQREGKAIESRGEPAGLVCMAGEADPYDYSVTVDALDADARAMTFLIPSSPPEAQAERIARSERIGEQGAAFDALAVAWRAYLIAEQAELDARDAHNKAEAAQAFILAVKATGGRAHPRASGKVQQVVSGLREYARFLSRSGIEGAAEIAAEIAATIPVLIAERAEAEARLWQRHHEKGATAEESQAEQVLHAIRSLLFSHAHLLGQSGGAPEGAELAGRHLSHVGWRMIGGEYRPQGVYIGWIAREIAYFVPSILCDLLQDKARLTLSGQRLREALEATGAAITGIQKGKNKSFMKRGPLGNIRCLALRLDALLPLAGEGEPETPEGAEITLAEGASADQAQEIAHQGEAPGGDRQAEQLPEIARAEGAAPLWCVGKHWFTASRVDSAASQALEWACPAIAIAAKWFTPTVVEAFTTGAPLAGVQVNGRPVSPDRFLALVRQAYEDNNRGMLANLARQVGASPAGVLPASGGQSNATAS